MPRSARGRPARHPASSSGSAQTGSRVTDRPAAASADAESSDVHLDGERLFTIYGSFDVLGVHERAVEIVDVLQDAVARYHERREPEAWKRAILWVVASTVVLVFVLLGLREVGRVSERFPESRAREGVVVAGQRLPFLESKRLAEYQGRALAALRALVVLVILLARFLLRAMRRLPYSVEQGRFKLAGITRDRARPLYKILRLVVIALTAVVIYPYVPGSRSASFQGISLFAGALFTLGAAGAGPTSSEASSSSAPRPSGWVAA